MDWLLNLAYALLAMLRDIIPIAVILFGFQVFVLRQKIKIPAQVGIGMLFVLLGLTLFLKGLDLALFPLGRLMAEQLTSPGFIYGDNNAVVTQVFWTDYMWVYAFAACVGFAAAIAEPALMAVAIKANQVSGGTITVRGLQISVATGAAMGVAVGSFRIVTGGPLHWYIICIYIVVIIQTIFTPK